jgi:RNA polymerase sigma factor (sigma-70 family)
VSATGSTSAGAEGVVLRRFVQARTAGDAAAMRDAWRELLTIMFDRLDGWVVSESFGRLSPQEQDDAVQLTCLKLARRGIVKFRGTTMGEWVTYARRVVRGACIDIQRREQRHSERRAAGDLGTSDDDDQPPSALDRAIAKQAREYQQQLEDEDEDRETGRDFLAWALPRLSESHREMIECDRAGLPIDEIMARMGRKRDAVYKLRERATRALGDLRKEYEDS